MKDSCMTLIGIGLAGFGGYWLGSAIYALIRGRQSVAWPVTEGTIVGQEESTQADLATDRSIDFLHPCYEYRVNCETFVSNTIKIGAAQEYAFGEGNVMARYPFGAKVKVHYNPRNPKIATIETGVSGSIIYYLVLGSFGLCFGVVSLVT